MERGFDDWSQGDIETHGEASEGGWARRDLHDIGGELIQVDADGLAGAHRQPGTVVHIDLVGHIIEVAQLDVPAGENVDLNVRKLAELAFHQIEGRVGVGRPGTMPPPLHVVLPLLVRLLDAAGAVNTERLQRRHELLDRLRAGTRSREDDRITGADVEPAKHEVGVVAVNDPERRRHPGDGLFVAFLVPAILGRWHRFDQPLQLRLLDAGDQLEPQPATAQGSAGEERPLEVALADAIQHVGDHQGTIERRDAPLARGHVDAQHVGGVHCRSQLPDLVVGALVRVLDQRHLGDGLSVPDHGDEVVRGCFCSARIQLGRFTGFERDRVPRPVPELDLDRTVARIAELDGPGRGDVEELRIEYETLGERDHRSGYIDVRIGAGATHRRLGIADVAALHRHCGERVHLRRRVAAHRGRRRSRGIRRRSIRRATARSEQHDRGENENTKPGHHLGIVIPAPGGGNEPPASCDGKLVS